MNIQQLEYILAVDSSRHFETAADKCNVTQPTLSMMIRKLEDELGIRIFDRTKQPIEPTPEGKEVLLRARQIMADVSMLKEFAKGLKSEVSGEIRLAIIPTLAPYLLPLFLPSFVEKYAQLRVKISELVTHDIIYALKNGDVDIGLLATPLHDPKLVEHPVFYEEFFAYTSDLPTGRQGEKAGKKKYLLPKDIDLSKLWLLEEGHCFRNQVFNLCELKMKDRESDRLHYEAGSLETLKNLVDHNKGITILPLLATRDLSKSQLKKIRSFAPPKPVREISVVVNSNYARKSILDALKKAIEDIMPPEARLNKKSQVLEIL
ncbi:MAG TPA: LysR substrate-binding domain-containing protein [Cyclobacteriaceae bacterium]|nr:LysR substrate-binding domain-containing protein [Cyclobacteriaceae bacterium]